MVVLGEVVDRIIKKDEYAKAGIPRYWVIERDSITTVDRHTLDRATGQYEPDPRRSSTADLAADHRPRYLVTFLA